MCSLVASWTIHNTENDLKKCLQHMTFTTQEIKGIMFLHTFFHTKEYNNIVAIKKQYKNAILITDKVLLQFMYLYGNVNITNKFLMYEKLSFISATILPKEIVGKNIGIELCKKECELFNIF